MFKKQLPTKLILLFIFLLALGVRFYGLDFDQGTHQHPDERFLTMVVSSLSMPTNLDDYFSQSQSSLNPYNNNFNFYVYGTFPLLLTRFFAETFNQTGYDQIYLVGRVFSVLFDFMTVILVFYLGRLLFKKTNIAMFAAFFYAIAVFPIQQAHFFIVDSFSVFFGTLTLFLFGKYITTSKKTYAALSGLSFGLALASKTSLAITAPLFIIALLLLPTKKLFDRLTVFLLFVFSGFVAFRLFQPYAFDGLFKFYPLFFQNITDAHRMITGEIDYPPIIQWAKTIPLLHPLQNIFFWGLGPVLSLFSLYGIILAGLNKKIRKNPIALTLFFYTAIIFFYQGVLLAKYMRYFYPIYPILAIFAGFGLSSLKLKRGITIIIIIIFIVSWPLAFLAIYSRPHSRVLASQWIYKNIPEGSKLTSEEWDDGLPLTLPDYSSSSYINIPLGLYNTESKEKWLKISSQLKEADYIILSSNRLYGSIPKMPKRYPQTTRYYQLLFAEKLGFTKIAEITSYPTLLGLQIPDDWAEESFTVFDHPKIIIFKKTKTDILFYEKIW